MLSYGKDIEKLYEEDFTYFILFWDGRMSFEESGSAQITTA